MKTKLMNAGVIIVLILFISLSSSAFAVEGGLGRPISGMSIAPYAGVIPPEPGFAFATGETYYEGSIGGGRTVPIAGLLVANVDMKASFTPLSLLYIWPTALSEAGFSRSQTMKALRRTLSTVLSDALSASVPSSRTLPSWVRVISILAPAGSTTSMSASASRVTPLTSAQA